MGHRRKLIAAAIVMTLGAAACAEASPSSLADGPTSSSTSSSASPVAGAPELLDFEAELLGGGTFRGADLAGMDVAFWFWAPW